MKKLRCLALSLALLGAHAGCTPEEQYDAKPVIYLYPEEETSATVRLDYDGELTTTYPAYENGWRFPRRDILDKLAEQLECEIRDIV